MRAHRRTAPHAPPPTRHESCRNGRRYLLHTREETRLTEFTARTDRQLVRTTHHSRRHVLLSLTAPAARTRRKARTPVNVAFVIDRSGSMAGVPMLLARQAVMQALNGLQPRDRFSVVTYDDHVETVVTSRTATPKAKETAQVRLAEVDA